MGKIDKLIDKSIELCYRAVIVLLWVWVFIILIAPMWMVYKSLSSQCTF
jgi:hypothetical protein